MNIKVTKNLNDKRNFWLSIIAGLIVAFLITLLSYVTKFLDQKIAINFTIIFIFIILLCAIIKYKSLVKYNE